MKPLTSIVVALALLGAACGSASDDSASDTALDIQAPSQEAPAETTTIAEPTAPESETSEPEAEPELASDAQPGTFTEADCAAVTNEVVVAELFADPTVECGYVAVPADWDEPEGDTIQLAVYLIPGEDPAPDPVVYLEGGPGGSGVVTVGDFANGSASYLREQRDVIVVDQRGTGYSIPALFCPEVGGEGDEDGIDPAGHQECRDRFVASDIDIGDYNSVNNALDLNAVREALGYEEWNLYGLSYGTRLALTAMRDTPQGIRSVILDSVFPPQINGISESTYTMYWAVDQIAANCAADSDCNIDAKALIEDGIARLSEAPVGDIDAMAYIGQLAESIAEPQIVEFITTVASGTDSDIVDLLEAMSSEGEDEELPSLDQIDPGFYPLVGEAVGMGYGVVCAEEEPFLDVKAGPVLGEQFRQSTQDIIENFPTPFDASLCSIWDVPSADEIATLPVSSDIPTLILAGTADIATPPEWSRLTGDTLSSSIYLEFPGLPHGLLGNNDCLNGLTADFLGDPTAELDQTCLNEFPLVNYEPIG